MQQKSHVGYSSSIEMALYTGQFLFDRRAKEAAWCEQNKTIRSLSGGGEEVIILQYSATKPKLIISAQSILGFFFYFLVHYIFSLSISFKGFYFLFFLLLFFDLNSHVLKKYMKLR